MTELIAKQRLQIASGGNADFEAFGLDPLTAHFGFAITRDGVWKQGSIIRTRLILTAGRERFEAVGQCFGGTRVSRSGRDLSRYLFLLQQPQGFFGQRVGLPRRLGEQYGKLDAQLILESLDGAFDGEIEFLSVERAAQAVPFHSSVAFDTASGVLEISGDATVSLSHTAGGVERAAFLGVGYENNGPSGQTLNSTTYAGNAATGIWADAIHFATQLNCGLYVKDASMGAGAQTVQSVVNTAGGTASAHGLAVISMTGVHQTTSIGTAPTRVSAASGTTPSITVAGVVAGGLVCDYLFGFDGANTNPAPAVGTHTERVGNQQPAGSAFSNAGTQLGADGGVMSWTKTSANEYSLGAVEFKPSATVTATPYSEPSPARNRPGRGPFSTGKFFIAQSLDAYSNRNSYTLGAVAGSYALTGQATALRAARRIAAVQGSYSLSGQAAGLQLGHKVGATQGSYALTGQATGLRADRRLTAAQGAYALTGQAAGLRTDRRLGAAQGAYVLTGEAAGLLRGGLLAAAQGSYGLTGFAASLRVARELLAAQGSYGLTGFATELKTTRKLGAGQGAYGLSGRDVGLLYSGSGDKVLLVSGGTYALSGFDPILATARRLTVTSGTYSLSGQAAALRAGKRLVAAAGVYVLSGQDVELLFLTSAPRLAAAAGFYALTGFAVELLRTSVQAQPSSVAALTEMDRLILEALDHVGLGDTMRIGTAVIRGYFNRYDATTGDGDQVVVGELLRFNCAAADLPVGLAEESIVEVEGYGSFRFLGRQAAGVGRVEAILGTVL